MEPLLSYVDAVTIPVPDLERGMDFYCGRLGVSPQPPKQGGGGR